MDTTLFDRAAALVQRLSVREKIRLVERIMEALEEDISSEIKRPKRSLYGQWAGVSISIEDIDEVRREMWGNFPHEDI